MKNNKKELEVVVIKDKMEKTVVVEFKQLVKHPIFKKYYTVKKKYKAHDQENQCKIGDRVIIRASKPISKEKRWAVVKVIQKAA